MYNNEPYSGSTAPGEINPQRYNPQEYTYVHGLGFTPLPAVARERHALRRSANSIGIAFIGYLILATLLPSLMAALVTVYLPQFRYFNSSGFLPDIIYQGITFFTTILAMGIPFAIYAASIHIPVKRAIPLKMPELSIILPAVFICLGASTVASVSSSMIQNILSNLGLYAAGNVDALPVERTTSVLYLINSVLLPAFLEEFIFRGIILHSLRRFGDGFAILISSILFAAAHGNVIVFPVALVVGLCISYFVVRTSSLWTGIIVHFCYNGMSIFLNELYSAVPYEFMLLVDSLVTALYLILGLISLIYLVRTRRDMFSLKPAQTLLNGPAKLKTFFFSGGIIAVFVIYGLMALLNISSLY